MQKQPAVAFTAVESVQKQQNVAFTAVEGMQKQPEMISSMEEMCKYNISAVSTAVFVANTTL